MVCPGEVSSVRKGLCDIIKIISAQYSWSLPPKNSPCPSTIFTASLKKYFIMTKPKLYYTWVFSISLLAWRWLLPSAIRNATAVDPPPLTVDLVCPRAVWNNSWLNWTRLALTFAPLLPQAVHPPWLLVATPGPRARVWQVPINISSCICLDQGKRGDEREKTLINISSCRGYNVGLVHVSASSSRPSQRERAYEPSRDTYRNGWPATDLSSAGSTTCIHFSICVDFLWLREEKMRE